MAVRLTVQTVRHQDQRYDTVGDWQFGSNGSFNVTVSSLSDWRMEFCVAIHELVEQAICLHRGIPQFEIDEFDMAFKGDGEPGDSPKAPYRFAHFVATTVERILTSALDVDWVEYEKRIDELEYKPKKAN